MAVLWLFTITPAWGLMHGPTDFGEDPFSDSSTLPGLPISTLDRSRLYLTSDIK
ncbi:MAG: hypothetical protein GX240_00460 [Candidatus Atribacteria bacterium]|nr:hypothetical protein [Candidatus Atribacteria bacterium]